MTDEPSFMDHSSPYPHGYIEKILAETKTIAIVGASPNPERPSHGVMLFLAERGYDVIPVNPRPGVEEIAGHQVFPSLKAIDRPVDMVDVFRQSDALSGIVDEAIAIGAQTVWAQLGVQDDAAARKAEAAGLRVVMNRCPKIELAT